MTRDFLISLALFAPALWCQTAARAEFEVASVKVSDSEDGGADWNPEHGNFTAENATLKQLIGFAYHFAPSMISGPGWLDSVQFDINAKGKGDAPDSQVRLMMQSLLEDRFHLKVHREKKEGPVYFLAGKSGGLNAQPADTPNPTPFPRVPPGPHAVMRESHLSMAELADALTYLAKRPVFDRTGIEGEYRVMMWWGNSLESDAPDLFTALQEQLGLKLESGRGPVETLIIDSADKIPTEN